MTSRHSDLTDSVALLYWCGCVSPFPGRCSGCPCAVRPPEAGVPPTQAGACSLSTWPYPVPPAPRGPGSPPCAGVFLVSPGAGLGWEQEEPHRRDLPLRSRAPLSFTSGSALRMFWGKLLTQDTVPQRAGPFHLAPPHCWCDPASCSWPPLQPALFTLFCSPQFEWGFCRGPWAGGGRRLAPSCPLWLPGKPPWFLQGPRLWGAHASSPAGPDAAPSPKGMHGYRPQDRWIRVLGSL